MARARPIGPRGRARSDLPQRRRGHGPEDGPLRPVPRLRALSRVQGDPAPRPRRRRRRCRSRSSRRSTRSARNAAAISSGAAAASGPSSRAATIRPASTSRRRRPQEVGLLCPECHAGAGGRAQGTLGTLLLRLPALPRVPVHRIPPAHSPSPAPSAPAPTCWRRRPRRRARSSSAATRPATSSARRPEPRPIPSERYTESRDSQGDDRRRGARRLRGRLAARAPRHRGRPRRDAAGARDPGAPDRRPRRARLLEQPAGERPRPGRGTAQGRDAAHGLPGGAGGRRGEGPGRKRPRRRPRPLRAPHDRSRRPPCPASPLRREEVLRIPDDPLTIVATGPLTSEPLAASLLEFVGRRPLYFYDAVSPVVEADSIDFAKAFRASRYGKGGDDYRQLPPDASRSTAPSTRP